MLFRFITIICLALLLPVSGLARESQIINDTGQPIASVTITTDVSGVVTATNSEGQFVLPDDQPITRVTLSCVGYQSQQFLWENLPSSITLKPMFVRGSDIVVRGDRAQEGRLAVAYDDFSHAEITRDYTVGELPLLLGSSPNLYSFADAGSALGYSYMKIRGFDDKRVSTYINGVPLNDPEDQATYFADLPDFASNVTDIQVQRGIGNSLYGDASFGGSVNIATNAFSQPQQTVITAGYGQYTSGGERVGNVYKQSIEYSTGLIDGRWLFSGRFSRQRTSGYRDNSWYQGWAYYFSLARIDPRMTTELYVYGGPIKMHLAYSGATRSQIAKNRLANPYHEYSNETDNFNQPHYHLHNVYHLNDNTALTNTLYYIRGKGFYEQFKDGRSFSEYGIDTTLTGGHSSGDLVRQQWVHKNQLGWNPRLDVDHDRGRHSLGGSFYYFQSDHWGQVVWTQNLTGNLDPRHRYYQYYGTKWVASAYGQEQYLLSDQFDLAATAQLRYQSYDFDQARMGAFKGHQYSLDWVFFSPRLTLTYRATSAFSLHGFAGVSSRTPTDASIYDANDPNTLPSLEVLSTSVSGADTSYAFGDPTARSERVYNFELGGRYRHEKYGLGLNLFWMDFRDEIVPNGGINENTGLPITVNADRSVHAGAELSGAWQALRCLRLEGNYSYNHNRVKEYTGQLDVYLPDWSSYKVDVDYADKTITGFPDHLANLIADFQYQDFRATARLQYAGQQYVELANIDSLAIKAHFVTSLSAEYQIPWARLAGDITLQLRVDNLFDKKYEASGYGWSYGSADTQGGPVTMVHEGEYFVAAERSFYAQLKLSLF